MIHICESAGDDHFLLFSHLILDEKKSELWKWLQANADVRIFSTLYSIETWGKRFPELDASVIKKVIDAYKEAEI